MPASLPVLQALDVGQDREANGPVQGVVLEEGRQLGHCGVLELLEPGGQQVVDDVGCGLGVDAEEALRHQDGVVDLALGLRLPLVGEQVVAQVHPVGKRVGQHPHRPGDGDGGRDLGRRGVLHQAGGPGGAAHLAAHLDVLDGVGNPGLGDVGQLPQRLQQHIQRGVGEPSPPVGGHRGHGARPQVGQAGLDGVGGFGGGEQIRRVHRHERTQAAEVLPGAAHVLRALECLQEVVVEEEHPHVPVGHEVQLGAGAVGVGVGTQQGVVVGVEGFLVPDGGPGCVLRPQDPHLVRPGLGMHAGLFQVGVQPGGIRPVEVRQLE